MTLNDLNNLYEVVKTLKFELKPSKETLKRIKFDITTAQNPYEIFASTKDLVSQQRSILAQISMLTSKKIVIKKDLIKIIDIEFFYKLKKWTTDVNGNKKQLSVDNTLSALIEKKEEFRESFYSYFQWYEDRLWLSLHSLDYALTIDKQTNPSKDVKKYTKTEIGFMIKKYCYLFVKIHQLLSLFVYKTWNADADLKSSLQTYFSDMNLQHSIQICSQFIKSYNPTIGFEIHKFWLNAKAIKKKEYLQQLEQQANDLEQRMNDLEEKKIKATMEFDEYVKQFNQKKIATDPKLVSLKNNQQATDDEIKKAKQYLKQISNGNFDYQTALKERRIARREGKQWVMNFTWDKRYHELKLKKIDLSVSYGRAKWDFFAKQAELYSQQQLTHYARLLRDGDKYFVIMVGRDYIKQLETLSDDSSDDCFEIMTYSSLTSKAVEKLIFERNALNLDTKDSNSEFSFCKKIRETRSYKQKWSQDIKANTPTEKQNLKKLVTFMNKAIWILNEKIEGGIFNWRPFIITDSFDDFSEFTKYITKTCYTLKREKIAKDVVYSLDKNEEIDFYQIYNKDFAVDEHCATTQRDKKSQTVEKKTGKPNLFTLYWKNLFADDGSTMRLNPESKLYIRPAKEIKDIDNYMEEKNWSKIRFRQNKIIADFQLIFYPTKELSFEVLQKKITDTYKAKSYFLGIDVGENSFATICLIDDQKKVVKEDGKPIIMDLSMINNKWDFVEEKDCLIDWMLYERKQKLLIEKNNTHYELWWYFSDNLQHKPIKDFSEQELQQTLRELEKIAPEELKIVDTNWNKVFDYVYAIEHLRTTNKILYHLQGFNKSDEEKEFIERELIDSTRLRNGYISKAVSVITWLAKKYNAMIVFENLDQKDYKWITLFAEQQLEKISGKEKRAYAGFSPYQLLQNRIIQKCNYLLQKSNDQVMQTTPRLKRVEDMKQMNQIKWQKDTVWWSVLFVNEQNSSKECPNCWFSMKEVIDPKIEGDKILRTDSINKEKKELSLSDELIKDRREAYQKVPEDLKSKEAWKDQIKLTSLFETRIKKWSLVYGEYLKVSDNDPMVCINCGYDTRKQERVDKYNLRSCDEIAAYIIAKRWLEFIQSDKYKKSLEIKNFSSTQKEDNDKKEEITNDDKKDKWFGYNPFASLKL